jgi:hypothetical protein
MGRRTVVIKPKGKRPLERNQDIDGKIILQWL